MCKFDASRFEHSFKYQNANVGECTRRDAEYDQLRVAKSMIIVLLVHWWNEAVMFVESVLNIYSVTEYLEMNWRNFALWEWKK